VKERERDLERGRERKNRGRERKNRGREINRYGYGEREKQRDGEREKQREGEREREVKRERANERDKKVIVRQICKEEA
jgi:hypothetical protein